MPRKTWLVTLALGSATGSIIFCLSLDSLIHKQITKPQMSLLDRCQTMQRRKKNRLSKARRLCKY